MVKMANIVFAVWGLGADSSKKTKHAFDHLIDNLLGVLFPVEFAGLDEEITSGDM